MKNNKKKHQRNRNLAWLMMMISMFLPYIIIMLVNHETYFTQKNGISMGLGCVACIIVAVIVASKNIKVLKGIGGFVVVAIISYLMDAVLKDLTIIAIWGGIGYAISLGFKAWYEHEQQYLKAYITKEVNEE